MSRWLPVVVGLVLVVGGVSRAEAQTSYPTVYGSTGRPYGPTQAEYQYQRQYGRPWHGYGGQVSPGSFGGTYVVPGSLGYSSFYGYQHVAPWGPPVFVNSPFAFGYAAPFAYSAPDPFIIGLENVTFPGAFTATPAPLAATLPANPVVTLEGRAEGDGFDLVEKVVAKADPSQRPVAPTSTAAKLKSLEKQAFGDEKVRKQQWAHAYLDYRAAVDAAPDRAEAHFRLGFLFTAMQHYASAVREFKRGVFLDPTLPQTGDKLTSVFGPNSQIVRTSILNKVSDWLREDIRDPDRLFLLGLLLHYEDDTRGREVLEAAQRMAANEEKFADHIAAFLSFPVEPPAIGAPPPVALPKLLPQPDAPNGAVNPRANGDNLPPAPLPAAPLPDAEPNGAAVPAEGLPPLKTTLP